MNVALKKLKKVHTFFKYDKGQYVRNVYMQYLQNNNNNNEEMKTGYSK